MVNVNILYTNIDAAMRFVDSCESYFKQKIEKICDAVVTGGNTKIITLCGPTCSGKTTTAAMITAALEKQGKRAKVLSIDDFYYDEEQMEKKNITDFESADAIDIELFSKTVCDLINGINTMLPMFDFRERRRRFGAEYIPENNDIYIIEGIQAMYPEIMFILKKYSVKSIFINVSRDIEICGSAFEKEEVRLMRRIVRDYFHRGTPAEKTMTMWSGVRENEKANILPYASKADYLIDSLMLYEVFVISKYFVDITESYNPCQNEYSVISSLRDRLKKLTASCITSAMVPAESVFREFIV